MAGIGPLRFSDWEVEGILGPGGVTETYRVKRALDPALNGHATRFALTLLREDRGGDDPAVKGRFLGAALRAKGVDEPGLVRIVEVTPDEATPAFFVSELVDGVDVGRLVELSDTASLSPGVVAFIGAQTARTLAALHDRGETAPHGGLAPGNVLVGRDGEVLLADVGIASALRTVSEYAIERYAFVAPELLESGAEPTPASDLWSLGALLFFLLTGNPPSTAETLPELRAVRLAGPPELPDDLPEMLAKVLRALLAPSPKDRPRSAANVALQLSPVPKTRGAALDPGIDPAVAADELRAAVARALEPPEVTPQQPVGATEVPLTLSPLVPAGAAVPPIALPGEQPSDSLYENVALGAFAGAPVAADPSRLSRVELPDLIGDRPSSVAIPIVGGSGSGPKRVPTLAEIPAIAADSPTIGVVDYGQEESSSGVGLNPAPGSTPGRGTASLKLPRMHGSARAGAARKTGKGARGRVLVALGATVAAALVALKLVFLSGLPPVVAPAPVEQKPTVPQPAPPAPPKPPPGEAGKLTVATTPPGATVWIDGEEKGKTPTTLQTKPGGHRIVITKPGFKMLREVADTSQSTTLKRTLASANANLGGPVALKVQCKTEGKYPVFIDGRDTGLLCPVDGLMIPEGNRMIGVFVIPQNKIWTFEREIPTGAKAHRVQFNY